MINNRRLKKQGYLTRLGHTVALISKKRQKQQKFPPCRICLFKENLKESWNWCDMPCRTSSSMHPYSDVFEMFSRNRVNCNTCSHSQILHHRASPQRINYTFWQIVQMWSVSTQNIGNRLAHSGTFWQPCKLLFCTFPVLPICVTAANAHLHQLTCFSKLGNAKST